MDNIDEKIINKINNNQNVPVGFTQAIQGALYKNQKSKNKVIEFAKILATSGNTQLVAFSIDDSDKRYIYDAFDLSLGGKLKKLGMTSAQFKGRAHILREKKKQGNSEYIAYEIRDKSVIRDIQLQD